MMKKKDKLATDGRIPLSNNLCEANIKPFATARRVWLFAYVMEV
ncbi:IS66 family transposase [Maledivibacter halophilus]|uniref:Transposase IS66 family protein n=1 Tax=Maledivibacter halophilus TaxID=36842 RepID=A0A1T5M948_9FIRM|nr:IS66 family transposase [Maledivibacter halophilus]SKC84757.1 Transposase IS66 family protein [Maledivibacter halophilus]